jgi:hypothetical protein
MPDGRIARFEVPEGTAPEAAQAMFDQHLSTLAAPKESAAASRDVPADTSPNRPIAPPADKSFLDTLRDKATAVGSGFNRSALAGLPGIPVDTLANLTDLAKAGVGTGFLLAGKAPPTELDPMDRTKVPGSSAWIMSKLQSSPMAAAINPTDPADEGGYMQAIGGALPGAGRGQILQAGMAGAASKAAHDATGSPVAALAGGLAPSALRTAGAAGLKAAVRGGEEGRLAMDQRVAELRAAGVDNPTVGLATGNRFLGGVENILADTPGAIGVMGRSRDNALRGLEATTQRAADLASTQRGALAAGQGIQSGAKSFAADVRARQEQLYGDLAQEIGPGTRIPVQNTRDALHGMTGATPGAEALTSGLVNPKIASTRRDFDTDTRAFSPGGEGAPRQLTPMLPFGGVKAVRTSVGEQLSNELLSGAPSAQWKTLYGGLSRDMENAAASAGPSAQQAFGRANRYTRGAMERAETLAPFASKAAPEDAYTSLVGTVTGGKNSVFDSVKKSLPEGVRGQVAGTVIENLGKAANGKQNAAGDVWSPETFLTNWNKLGADGQRKVLSGFPNADEVRSSIESVAKSTAMMRENNLFSNASGTAGSTSARDFVRKVSTPAALVAAGGGGLVSPWVPAAAVAGLGTTNALARGLTSPGSVNFLRSRTEVTPETQQNLLRTLYLTGAMRDQQQ